MQVELLWVTPDAEALIAYIARVSSPNQDNPEYERLLSYLIRHGHWSPFEMAGMCVEIVTSRAVSAQLIRHRSFSFQEFSQRYSDDIVFEPVELRKQAVSNRQGSMTLSPHEAFWLGSPITCALTAIQREYRSLIQSGVAREVARFILPMCTQTKLYMAGSIRSWIHYLQVRTKEDTQKEHRQVAEAVKAIFCEQFPVIGRLAFQQE